MSQHFLLKWNNHRSNLITVFENLLQESNLVDVTLAVEGKFLKAHRIVLCACSPYFNTMFNQTTSSHPIVVFHDLKFNHLKILLEFMYRGEISIDEKDLSEVLKVAESLSIRGLSSFEEEEEVEEATAVAMEMEDNVDLKVDVNNVKEEPLEKKKKIIKRKKRVVKRAATTTTPSSPPLPTPPIRRRLAKKFSTSKPPPPPPDDSESLAEMSVRGLDLFKYASVEDGVYRCMECEKMRIPKTFKNKYSFQRHAFLYHEGNMRKVFPCPVCGREFSRPDKMKNHLRGVHANGVDAMGGEVDQGGGE